MTGSRARPGSGIAVANILRLEDFRALFAELQRWRTDPDVQDMQRDHGRGLVFPFAKGLRLSARLVYAIRKRLSAIGVKVDWGQIITPEGYCSPECDIIIHKPGSVSRWNGNEKPVMDFVFVEHDNALAVISCKSSVTTVDKDYAKAIKTHLPNLFLFGECCSPGAVGRLKRAAKAAGYKGFWYLYTYDAKTEICVEDENVWQSFLQTLEKAVRVSIGQRSASGTSRKSTKRALKKARTRSARGR